jgi:hypothetical protein
LAGVTLVNPKNPFQPIEAEKAEVEFGVTVCGTIDPALPVYVVAVVPCGPLVDTCWPALL